LLEAMETGTPVVAANSGGSSELAEFFPDHIHLYDRYDPGALEKLLQEKTFEPFNPPDLPEPLTWTTIAEQTHETLRLASR
ncbi:MAG: hypothetical protein ABEK50_16415, partial [bacterium]